jgi:hypothetical protein
MPVFVPIYRALVGMPADAAPSGELSTLGIDLPAATDRACVASLARVRDPAAFPVQLAVGLTGGWRTQRHYQVLARLGGPNP